MIRTRLVDTLKYNTCDAGPPKAYAALKKYGLTPESWVDMRDTLRELGLNDALFAFVKVKKGDEKEARRVLREYMRVVSNCAYNSLLICLAEPAARSQTIKDALRTIDKRVAGLDRRPLLAASHTKLVRLYNNEIFHQDKPEARFWIKALMSLTSEYADHLCAVHATQDVLNGGEAVGIRKEMYDMLEKALLDAMEGKS